MNLDKKIYEVKKLIAQLDTPKEGKNLHMKYNHYTPEQITGIITYAFEKVGGNLVSHFQLLQDDYGLYGQLEVKDLEDGESRVFIHRTGLPNENKGMNVAQCYGAVSTYSHRYLLQHTFGIVDNSLDFDNDDPFKHEKNNTQNQKPQTNGTPVIDKNQIKEFYQLASSKNITPDRINKLLGQYGIKTVESIPSVKYSEILSRIKAV